MTGKFPHVEARPRRSCGAARPRGEAAPLHLRARVGGLTRVPNTDPGTVVEVAALAHRVQVESLGTVTTSGCRIHEPALARDPSARTRCFRAKAMVPEWTRGSSRRGAIEPLSYDSKYLAAHGLLYLPARFRRTRRYRCRGVRRERLPDTLDEAVLDTLIHRLGSPRSSRRSTRRINAGTRTTSGTRSSWPKACPHPSRSSAGGGPLPLPTGAASRGRRLDGVRYPGHFASVAAVGIVRVHRHRPAQPRAALRSVVSL
jgi:hypothetical protein